MFCETCLTIPCPRCLQGNCRWLTSCALYGRWPTQMPTLPTTCGCWSSPSCGPPSARRRSSRCLSETQHMYAVEPVPRMWAMHLKPRLLPNVQLPSWFSCCFEACL